MPSKRVIFKKFLLGFLFVLGLTLVFLGGYLSFTGRAKPAAPIREGPKKEVSLHSKPNPVRLIVNSVKIDLPITEGSIVDGIWQTTQTGVSHLDISGNPGEGGNIVIYGHNLRVILGSLPYVPIGSIVKVVAEDSKEYTYKVYKKKVVTPSDLSITYATPDEVLTIYTCDGPLDGTRFVLLAGLITT